MRSAPSKTIWFISWPWRSVTPCFIPFCLFPAATTNPILEASTISQSWVMAWRPRSASLLCSYFSWFVLSITICCGVNKKSLRSSPLWEWDKRPSVDFSLQKLLWWESSRLPLEFFSVCSAPSLSRPCCWLPMEKAMNCRGHYFRIQSCWPSASLFSAS